MRNHFSDCTIVIFTVLFSLAVCDQDAFSMTTEQAFQAVTNVSSSSKDFVAAMKQLETFSGDKSLWLRLAADDRYDSDRRRHFVKHLFDHFVPVGMHLEQVPGFEGKPANWISYDHIRKEKRGDLGGWVPESLLKGESGFTIPILPGAGGHYNLVVFISFKENLKLEDVLLTAQGKTSISAKASVVACKAWDSDDQERKFPGSKSHPWPW